MQNSSQSKDGVWNRLKGSVRRSKSKILLGDRIPSSSSSKSAGPGSSQVDSEAETNPSRTGSISERSVSVSNQSQSTPRGSVISVASLVPPRTGRGPETPSRQTQSAITTTAAPGIVLQPDLKHFVPEPSKRAAILPTTPSKSKPTSQQEQRHQRVRPQSSTNKGQNMAASALRSATNGNHALNGYFSPPSSPSVKFGGSQRDSIFRKSLTSSFQTRGPEKTSIVRDTAIALKKKSASVLGAGISDTADRVSFVNLVEWIRSERLSTLPHKGSRWDTVLIRSLYFAERLHGFESTLKGFALDSEPAAQLGYGHIRLLLELGHENGDALDKAFGFLYRSSSSVSAVLARSRVLKLSSEIYEQLCTMYGDLLTLVIDVAIRLYKAVHGASEGSVSLDMYQVFGDSIVTFRERRIAITKAIWGEQLIADDIDEDESVDVIALSRWLAPQDRVLDTVALDHTLIADELAEFTCVWFHDDLAKFVKGSDHVLLVNGPPGSGKTTLAGSSAERLQRPVSRKTFSTLFVSVGAIPSQATTLNVVKALLHQLLNIRVGNMHLYYAVAHAYDEAKYTADPAKYEDLLWRALEDALRTPLDNAQDTILIVEGLDELIGGQEAAQVLLKRLVEAVDQGKGVKLLAFGQHISLPTGTRGVSRTITLEDTHSDIHEVVMKSLIRSDHFRPMKGREQEDIVQRIIETSSGSFLWASLYCELLHLEQSTDTFSKTVSSIQKSSIDDLTQKIITTLDPTEEMKQLLSWIVQSARPLTSYELESLFAVNAHGTARSGRSIDVQAVLRSLAPLLSVHEDIVRTRHILVHTAIQNLFRQGKIVTTVKDQPLDFLFRLLNYAKLALPEKGEPTLDDTDRSPVQYSFERHQFLEYVIRYWTWHLQQTSIVVPGSTEFKIPTELQKVFPQSTVMPILEWLCWDDQFPGAQEVEFHELVGRLRSKVLSEKHPAVLQSYINTAAYFDMMKNVTRASTLYYTISTIGRTVLSVSHPVVVECATRFLRLTHSSITNTRTEIMTHREHIFLLLIAAYERQYGVSSEIVVQTRERLAELYLHINEQNKANEVLGFTQDTSEDTRGVERVSTGTVDGRSWIEVKKRREAEKVDGFESVFAEQEDEEGSRTIVDLTHVESWRRQIEQYITQKDLVSAELAYIELWQRLSESCRTTLSVDWHQKKIETVQAYAKFLETQQRRSEAISLTTSLWQEYEHHELSFAEAIVSRLTESARFLKSIGEYSAALSIFKHASSYFKNVRKSESRSASSIEEEMMIVSNEALKQQSVQQRSISESSQLDMFSAFISNKSRSLDSSTVTLAKQLTSRYVAQKNWNQAISIIHSTLERSWSSFLSKSVHEVTMTTTFQKESIELAEQLAECYIQQRQFERAEDVYVRLLRAALSNPKDQTTLERVRNIIIGFYTKRGHPDKIIGVYQELLALYRRVLGPSHETTISTLYELATRCRAHARSHPYWIEYYQQIVTVLNKDSNTCHTRALEAAIIVAESYWEERRYSDAVQIYGIIWSTFVHKSKDSKYFSDVNFVRSLYERYYQCLEETKADWEVLRTVTNEYRETTKSVFGASSSIAIEATVALATVLSYSEQHAHQAISLYEEASSHLSQSKSASDHSINSSELNRSLTTLYKRRIVQSSSKSLSSDEVQKATNIYSEQLAETRKSYGYSHEASLNSLHELSLLYARHSKSEAASKELSSAVTEIITKEQSSQRSYEAATSIVRTYQATGLEQQCTQLIEDLHYQLITKEQTAKSTLNVTQVTQATYSAALFFLAVLQYQTRKDLSVTLSEIFASIKAESILYGNYKQLLVQKATLDKVLIAAAPLRYHLKYWSRNSLLQKVDNEAVKIFIEREVTRIDLLSKEASSRHFIVGIMDYIGNRKNVDFVRAVIVSANITLKRLVDNNQFKEAHDVAKMAFKYAQFRKGYRGPNAIARGFTLASYLDGRGENKCPDPELRKQLLKLSNDIVKDILKICREENINLAHVNLSELNELIALLGEQKDCDTLEMLLNQLWSTREAQRNWAPDVLLRLGRRLICARYLVGHQIKALRLCEDIAYNLRRVNGIKDPATLDTYELLAQLYTRTGQLYQNEAASDKIAGTQAAEHFKKAILVHDDVLRWLLNDKTGGEIGDDDDDDTAAAILAEHGVKTEGAHAPNTISDAQRSQLVKRHLYLLKLAYQRLGSWPKASSYYEKLNADLFRTFGDQLKGTEGVEKWQTKGFGAGKAESSEGVFSGNTDWEILVQ